MFALSSTLGKGARAARHTGIRIGSKSGTKYAPSHTRPLSIAAREIAKKWNQTTAFHRMYTSSNVSVPERSIEGFDGPTDSMHYTDDVERACRQGIKLKDAGKAEEALKEFTNAILLSGETSYRAYSLRGDLNQTLGRIEEALFDYGRVIKFLPTHIPTLTSQASCYKRMGDYEKAKSDFEFILSFEGMYAPAWIGKAECHAQLGEHDLAVAAFQKALEHKDRWIPEASVYEALANSLMMTNKVEAALEAYQSSLRLFSGSASCWGAFGVALYVARKFPEATDAFTQALNLGGSPRFELLSKRASCYLHFRNLKKAMSDCTEALNEAPNFYKANLIRGQCRQESNEIEGAVEDYDAFLAECDSHLTPTMRASAETMSEHWHQVATVRVRRAECLLELWTRDLMASGVEIPQFENVPPEPLSQSQIVSKFEDVNQILKVMGPKAGKLRLSFDDLVEARKLHMTQPDIPFLLDLIKRVLSYKFTLKSTPQTFTQQHAKQGVKKGPSL